MTGDHFDVAPPELPDERPTAWWQDWRWWASISAALAMVAILVFGTVAYVSQRSGADQVAEQKTEISRLRYENTCRSRRAATITLASGDQTAATGRGLVVALAGDDPRVRALIDRYLAGAKGVPSDTLFLVQAKKLLIAANAIDDARSKRADAEEVCAAEALERYPA